MREGVGSVPTAFARARMRLTVAASAEPGRGWGAAKHLANFPQRPVSLVIGPDKINQIIAGQQRSVMCHSTREEHQDSASATGMWLAHGHVHATQQRIEVPSFAPCTWQVIGAKKARRQAGGTGVHGFCVSHAYWCAAPMRRHARDVTMEAKERRITARDLFSQRH